MKIITNACYSHVLYLLLSGDKISRAVNSIKFKAPDFYGEGFNGYIDTEVEIDIKDLEEFTKIWNKWYSLDDKVRNSLYSAAKEGLYK